MALRTTAVDVKKVLMRDYDTVKNPDLTPQITAANGIVTRVVTCAAERSPAVTFSTQELKDIETWLAAHFYAVSDKPYASKNTGKSGASFNGQTAMGLDFTAYGQTAKMLDVSGCLAALMERRTASILWLGKAPSDQTDYVDRD